MFPFQSTDCVKIKINSQNCRHNRLKKNFVFVQLIHKHATSIRFFDIVNAWWDHEVFAILRQKKRQQR